ncbi:MAG: dTMP kinase [Akkermansiaceae bacterium]
MAFIAFLGCDGSGKSAVIEQLAQVLRSSGSNVWCGHWRPQSLDQKVSSQHISSADDPHGQAPRGALTSVIKLVWLWLNWWIGWIKTLGHNSKRGYVIYDRYHGDLRVDPIRYRYGGPRILAEWASNLMPQPDIVFFLDADPDVLLSRKQEVSRVALTKSREAYLQLTKCHSRFCVIDASQPLDQVVENVLKQTKDLS